MHLLSMIQSMKQNLLVVKCLDKILTDEVSLLFLQHQKKTSREVEVVAAEVVSEAVAVDLGEVVVDSEEVVVDSEVAVEDVVEVADADVVVRHQIEVKDRSKNSKDQN